MKSELLCGIDRIHTNQLLPCDLRYGLVTNTSSINHNGISVLDELSTSGFTINALFSPEHGFSALGADGVFQPNSLHTKYKVPILSLYGQSLKPLHHQFNNLDAIIIDLPNIGVRYYTYLWTMSQVLEACHHQQIPVYILDRPNPLGGNLTYAEGPMLHADYFSFIGEWSIPIRFGLTLGELALLLKKEKRLERLNLYIIQSVGWSRSMDCNQYLYPFRPPSPGIKQPSTVWTYPALCYLEATTVSEGRGTDFPFQLAVAPWINLNILIPLVVSLELPGISISPVDVCPVTNKYKDQRCHGIVLTITDHAMYRPVKTGMMLLAAIRQCHPDRFEWQPYPTLVNPGGTLHFEKLTGSYDLKKWLDHQPLDHTDVLDKLLTCNNWSERCSDILLYE